MPPNELRVQALIDGEMYRYNIILPPRRQMVALMTSRPRAMPFSPAEDMVMVKRSRRKRNHFVRDLATKIAQQIDKLATQLERQ